jgi:hypothetical protein
VGRPLIKGENRDDYWDMGKARSEIGWGVGEIGRRRRVRGRWSGRKAGK